MKRFIFYTSLCMFSISLYRGISYHFGLIDTGNYILLGFLACIGILFSIGD